MMVGVARLFESGVKLAGCDVEIAVFGDGIPVPYAGLCDEGGVKLADATCTEGCDVKIAVFGDIIPDPYAGLCDVIETTLDVVSGCS